jgi:hypothetical protein
MEPNLEAIGLSRHRIVCHRVRPAAERELERVAEIGTERGGHVRPAEIDP